MRCSFAARARQLLRRRALEVITGGEEQLAGVVEEHSTAVMLVIGVLRIFVEDELAARDRAGQMMRWR